MKNIFLRIILLLINFIVGQALNFSTPFDAIRSKIIEEEQKLATGGEIILSEIEENVNKILMEAKLREISEGLKNIDLYPPAMHFFKSKSLIKESVIYRILRIMPKGAMLHGHNTAMVSSNWIIKNLTYDFNVMTCYDKNEILLFTFRNNSNCVTPLKTVCNERAKAPDKKVFDKTLERHISMYTPRPEVAYANLSSTWKRFENIFDTLSDFIKFVPVFKIYHYRLLQELYDDNIFYAEIRTPLSTLYGTNKKYTPIDVAKLIEEVIQDFKRTHPKFLGMKIIYVRRNTATREEMYLQINEFKRLYEAKPNLVIGFDIIGQEDTGARLHTYINELQRLPKGAQFFFHAGETNWNGKSDWNLLDAILLNTKRIGHGFALLKHTQLWQSVKKRKIAIEVSPLSNQILRFISDLRNHPAAFFISENIPIVITSDDPGIWNSQGLSFDFYYAFMCFASENANLGILKQFALNSIRYSVLKKEERRKANELFNSRWNAFLNDVLDMRY